MERQEIVVQYFVAFGILIAFAFLLPPAVRSMRSRARSNPSEGLGNALMGLEQFYRPSVTYVAEAKSSPVARELPSDEPLQPVPSVTGGALADEDNVR